MTQLLAWGNGIYAIDANYVRPLLASIHFVVDDGEVAIIDTGSNEAVPHVQTTLAQLGLSAAAVRYVVLTHIHLDHAGGAGQLMAAFPSATLVVHHRGARHMAAPARLIEGVKAVYGSEYVERVYGEILPIPEARILAVQDGQEIPLGRRTLRCLDTPGHARHHICVVDSETGAIFTGDMFGLSYREMDVDGRQFIFPTTTPTQFDPQEMRDSIQRLLALNPPVMYLTHFSQLQHPAAQGEQLLVHLDELVVATEAVASLPPEQRKAQLANRQRDYLFAALRGHGVTLPDSELDAIWATDLELNTQGLIYWQENRA